MPFSGVLNIPHAARRAGALLPTARCSPFSAVARVGHDAPLGGLVTQHVVKNAEQTVLIAGDELRKRVVVTGGGTTTGGTGGTCTTASWSSSQVYTAGNTVSWSGHNWSAKWWTQGEEPGTTGEWGVWQDLGAC